MLLVADFRLMLSAYLNALPVCVKLYFLDLLVQLLHRNNDAFRENNHASYALALCDDFSRDGQWLGGDAGNREKS